jgi:hypothetical protein
MASIYCYTWGWPLSKKKNLKLLRKHINSQKMDPTVIIIITDDKKQPFFTAYPNDLFT